MFAGVHDPEEWLQDHLEVGYPENGQILAISLSGPESQADDLSLIVDAVAGAYDRGSAWQAKQLDGLTYAICWSAACKT